LSLGELEGELGPSYDLFANCGKLRLGDLLSESVPLLFIPSRVSRVSHVESHMFLSGLRPPGLA